MTVIIEGADNIRVAGLLQMLHMLGLEINTGLKHSRGPLLPILARVGYTGPTRGTVKNKRAAMQWLVEQITAARPGYEVSASVARAMAS